jgi:hypothetical protein
MAKVIKRRAPKNRSPAMKAKKANQRTLKRLQKNRVRKYYLKQTLLGRCKLWLEELLPADL